MSFLLTLALCMRDHGRARRLDRNLTWDPSAPTAGEEEDEEVLVDDTHRFHTFTLAHAHARTHTHKRTQTHAHTYRQWRTLGLTTSTRSSPNGPFPSLYGACKLREFLSLFLSVSVCVSAHAELFEVEK